MLFAELNRERHLWVDLGGMLLYTLAMVLLGWYYNRRQKTLDDYFLCGGRMSALVVGVSLFSAHLGPISYLAMPGEVIGRGPMILGGVLGLPFAYWIVGYVLLPAYMRYRVTSAYELLEVRLGLGARLVGATIFIILRMTWMAILIYLTSTALTVMLGIQEKWTLGITVAAGVGAILYTAFGGLRVAVISDFVQAVLMFLGVLFVIGFVTYEFLGFNWIPTVWQDHWDAEPLLSFEPGVRVTLLGSAVSVAVWTIATAGGDQISVQRFMTVVDARAARRAFLINTVCTIAITALLGLLGVALLGYFREFPGQLPDGASLSQNADQLFPYFIHSYLPNGFKGMVVIALFAAAMSCFDSGLNSVAAVLEVDFLKRLEKTSRNDFEILRSSKIITFAAGGVVILLSTLVQYVPGGYLEIAQKTTHLFVTPLFALFFCALFAPWVTQAGAVVGVLCGIVLGVLVSFSGLILTDNLDAGTAPVSFQWTGLIALSGSIGVAMLIGLTTAFAVQRPLMGKSTRASIPISATPKPLFQNSNIVPSDPLTTNRTGIESGQ